MMKKIPSLELKNIKKSFGSGHTEVTALKGINFTIYPGEFVSIIGPSGSGKSTFLTIAGGLQTPDSGEMFLNQVDFTHLDEKRRGKLRLKDIGFILQGTNLIPFLKVEDQFKFIDQLEKRPFSDSRLAELLTSLDILDLVKKMPRDLSGGERQRVAIAKALYNDPALILADEPTAALDTTHALEVVKLLAKEAHDKQKATIMVTHDPRMVAYSDRVFTMKDGLLTLQTEKEPAHAATN